MSTHVSGLRAYTPVQIDTTPAAPKPKPASDLFRDLLKAVTPEEALALTENFGPARTVPAKGADHRGRHLDIRA